MEKNNMAYPQHTTTYVLLKIDDGYGGKVKAETIAVSDNKQTLMAEKETLELKEKDRGYQVRYYYQIDSNVKRI